MFHKLLYHLYQLLNNLFHRHNNYVPLNKLENTRNFPNIQKQRYPIQLMTDSGEYCVSREGRHRYSVGECTLFPSREQRDWSKFTAPWLKKERFDPKTLQPFDKVIAKCNDFKWVCEMFSHYDISKGIMPYVCVGGFYNVCIPYNEDTKHLVGTKDEAPDFYKYWED